MNKEGFGYDGDAYLRLDKCVDFDNRLWFELGKFMLRKHQSFYQDHLKYVRNDIVKPFHMRILRYSEHVMEMHDLAKDLPPPSMKGKSYDASNWKVHDQKFTVSKIRVSIKDGLPLSMQDELEDHQ